ncbi:MAG: hypothetical protein AAFZ52_18765, partial [Bacteroidota bacterium]
MTLARDFYAQTQTEQSALAARENARYERFTYVRLLFFFGWVAALIVAFGTDWRIGLGLLLLTLPLVAAGVRWHRGLKQRANKAVIRAELAGTELRALNHDFSRFADGVEFLEPGHPYTLDLDIFGPHSLFQFLNRTVTAPGKERLAVALLAPKTAEERARTQVQGKALTQDPSWSLEFRTIGYELGDKGEYFTRLQSWLRRPAVVITNRWERLILHAAPLLTLAGLTFMLVVGPWYVGAVAFVPALLLLRKYAEIIPREHAYVAAMGQLLRGYAELLAHVGTRPGGEEAKAAAPALRKLAYRVSQLDVRYNPFVFFLEVGGLWSLQWLRKLDQWRANHAADLPRWLDLLADTDELVSWATLRHNQAEWTDPEFTDAPVVQATELGHPLLPPNGCVTNDVEMRTDGHLHLVTGSNMAGKSTWLRTVGTNLVLAQAGAPVRSRHLRLRPLQVWTSMRTQDDLSESTSSFYAELKRLKAIIAAVADPDQQVFFLLDEILKGTNSRDRHTGSRALIRQLQLAD